MVKSFVSILITFSVLCTEANSESTVRYIEPTLAKEEVTRMIEIFLDDKKIDHKDHSISDFSYDYIHREWKMTFETGSLAIGWGFYAVVLTEDEANSIRLIPH